VHGLNLKLYLEMGLKLVAVRRGIVFHQEKFIAPFIEQCTRMRAQSTSATEQNIWKTIANSAYGKVKQKIVRIKLIFL
jgi:hypothetical protein